MKNTILKIYFDGNNLSKEDETKFKKIVSLLNKHGCNVVQTVMATDWDYAISKGRQAAVNIYSSKIRDVHDTDALVCEITNPNSTITFEIFEALSIKKPTLLLYDGHFGKNPELAFIGNPSKHLFIEPFTDDNLEDILLNFIEKAKSVRPITRFTVRLNKEMGDYLNYLKSKLKLSSKNDVVNNIIENMMNEDYDYLKN